MHVISWNVERIKKRVGAAAIANALINHEPSVIALHEFSEGEGGERLAERLNEVGYRTYAHPAREFPFRMIVFARHELELLVPPVFADDPFWVEARCAMLRISAVHIPLRTKGYAEWRKAHWEGALSLARTIGDRRHLIIGDLNTTLHGIDEKYAAVPGNEYLRELESAGWVEAWRKVPPDPSLMEYSWYHPRPPHNGFRIDQAWMSAALTPLLQGARMDHKVRENKLSDHSMLIVDFDMI